MKISDSEGAMHATAVTSAGPVEARDENGRMAPWWHTAVTIVVLLGMSFLGSLHVKRAGFGGHHTRQYLVTMGFEWALLGFTWLGLRLRRVPFASLMGVWRRGWAGLGKDLAFAGIFWIMAMVLLGALAIVLRLVHAGGPPPQKALAALAPQSAMDLVLWLGLCLTAGVCEELIFRGYFLRQFAVLGKRAWVGVLLSSLLFGASHGYEGLATMIVITFYGAMFCVLAMKSRSLRPGMIAHGWHDLFTGVMLALMRHLHAI